MSDWETLTVAHAGGESLSPAVFLRALHRQRQLRGLLVAVLAEQVTLRAAAQAGLSVTAAELQQAADRFRHRHGLTSAESTRQWLGREGLSVEDFETGLENELLVEKLKTHLAGPQVGGHFAANRDRYARAQLRQIVAPSEEVARELLAQLTEEGKEFAELAKAHSLHGPSRLAGGSLGLIARVDLPRPVADAVFSAPPGKVVGPVATAEGFHLFLVEARPDPVLDHPTATLIRAELFASWLRDQLRDVRIDLTGLQSPG